MKFSYVLFGLFALLALTTVIATEVDMEVEVDAAPCHPQCRWQCDDPSCPAQCRQIQI